MKKELKQLYKNIDCGNINWNSLFKLTGEYIKTLDEEAIPLYTPFGSFYMEYLPKRFKACLYILYTEVGLHWVLYSAKLKKGKKDSARIPAKKTIKLIAWLINQGVLVPRGTEPFEEFEYTLKPPETFAILTPAEGWEAVLQDVSVPNFQADDDVSDLKIFLGESDQQ